MREIDDPLIHAAAGIFHRDARQLRTLDGHPDGLTPVEIGLLNDDLAEIKAGLSENDVVVLAPESSLTEGARVNVVVREALDTHAQ